MHILTAKDIEAKKFRTNFRRTYYDAGEVDEFLDQLKATVNYYEHPSNVYRITNQLAEAVAERVAVKLEHTVVNRIIAKLGARERDE